MAVSTVVEKVFQLNVTEHEIITFLRKIKDLGEPEHLLVKRPYVKLWRKMIFGANGNEKGFAYVRIIPNIMMSISAIAFISISPGTSI